ncbi:MAG: 1-deoxy-D-xylulose-5-phosphate reductoisomerase [Planctomycetota bacterium]|nr:1-deoxy-D-xylulose-5-phosphate reductoisomerase [Planctomycetota bacterium]
MPARQSTTTSQRRRLIILGSTGSIGTQTLEVVRNLNALAAEGRSPVSYEVVGLAAGRDVDSLAAQAKEFGVRSVALANGAGADSFPSNVKVHRGPDAAEDLVRAVEADVVIAAIVGAAGLPATLAAIELGRDVALANKETLVAAGALVVPAAQKAGVCLLPVDSEHSAIWQCLPPSVCPPCTLDESVARLVLTASGGPFRTWSASDVYNATPEQALAHPTWNMGATVTIDCASLTNKGLEVIEAHWLFGLPSDRIDVVVHPQSIVHSFVEFVDRSGIAQLGSPDMRTPIQFALTFPTHVRGIAPAIDFTTLSRLDFQPPDLDRFPALRLAFDVIDRGGVSGAVFNAANEAAVEAFIAKRIPFGRITELAAAAMRSILGDARPGDLRSLDDVRQADQAARDFVADQLSEAAAAR